MPVPVVSAVTLAVSVPRAPLLAVTVPTLCASVRSTSVKAMVPVLVRLPAGVVCSVTAPVTLVRDTTGASLVPVMVMTTSCVVVEPLPSLTVTVYVSVLTWPAARYCAALLVRLYVQPTEPGSVAALSLTAASARAPSAPLTGAKLTVCASVRSTSVKPMVPVATSASVSDAVVSASSVTAPVCAALVIVTASLVPVMVMARLAVLVALAAPLPSLAV